MKHVNRIGLRKNVKHRILAMELNDVNGCLQTIIMIAVSCGLLLNQQNNLNLDAVLRIQRKRMIDALWQILLKDATGCHRVIGF